MSLAQKLLVLDHFIIVLRLNYIRITLTFPQSCLVVSWCIQQSQFNESHLMCGSIMLSSTPLLITIKKLARLIIANVLQWKCQCGSRASRYYRGNDVLSSLLEKVLIERVLLKSATTADRYGFRCGSLSFSTVSMTPLEHIRWNFNVPRGQIGSLHIHVRGKLWTYSMSWHPTFTITEQGAWWQSLHCINIFPAKVSLSRTMNPCTRTAAPQLNLRIIKQRVNTTRGHARVDHLERFSLIMH